MVGEMRVIYSMAKKKTGEQALTRFWLERIVIPTTDR